MAYCIIDDIFKRYPLVDNIVGAATHQVASVDVSSIYIADAQSIVNGFLTVRYQMPLTTEPMLTWITADLAIYKMFEDKLPNFPAAIEKRYTNCICMLWSLQKGQLQLTSSNLITSGGDQDAWTSASSNAGIIFHPAEEITNTRSIFDPFFSFDRQSF